jgi:hypothetical protein
MLVAVLLVGLTTAFGYATGRPITLGAVVQAPDGLLAGLYRINIFLAYGFDILEKFMGNIAHFHSGGFYLNPVPMEKVFSPFPPIQRGKL